MKKIITHFLIFTIPLSVCAQYTQTFEDPNTFTIGGQGYATGQISVTAEAPPAGTTNGDGSATAIKYVENAGIKAWHFGIITPVGSDFKKENGNYVNLYFLAGQVGSGNFGLGLKGSGATEWFTASYNATSTNEWIRLEFDISGYSENYSSRIELDQDKGGTKQEGRVFYIDGIQQTSQAVLSTEKISLKTIEIYPNPTDGLLHISAVSDMQRVNILNLLGQNVKTFEAANTLDVSDLKEGVYFLSADNGLTRKFIKR